jgi:NAD(P)-dependent dehydrogenase (short-subunit alcohol dehydrogenase family)
MSASEIARGTKTYRRTTYPAIDATQTSLSTKGKSAVVTGAGQGIGANIARTLVRSGIDYLALMGRRPGTLASVQAQLAKLAPECKIFTYIVDIVDEKAVEKGFVDFVADMGGERPIDVLIANAGYMADLSSLDSVDVDDWWKGFEINGTSPISLPSSFLILRCSQGELPPPTHVSQICPIWKRGPSRIRDPRVIVFHARSLHSRLFELSRFQSRRYEAI